MRRRTVSRCSPRSGPAPRGDHRALPGPIHPCTARRTLSDDLPLPVVEAVLASIDGDLGSKPGARRQTAAPTADRQTSATSIGLQRSVAVSRRRGVPPGAGWLTGTWSARRGTYRILYEIEQQAPHRQPSQPVASTVTLATRRVPQRHLPPTLGRQETPSSDRDRASDLPVRVPRTAQAEPAVPAQPPHRGVRGSAPGQTCEESPARAYSEQGSPLS